MCDTRKKYEEFEIIRITDGQHIYAQRYKKAQKIRLHYLARINKQHITQLFSQV